jgi:16S rRNA processing protein RimM
MVQADLIEIGRLRGAYGVQGWVRVAPHQDGSALLHAKRWWLSTPQGDRAVDIASARIHGSSVLAKWAGCDTKEAADALKGVPVRVARADFPPLAEDEHYWIDLIGATVVNRQGVTLGEVAGLQDNGAQALLEVRGATSLCLIPVVPQYVERIDAAARRIEVDWEADW